MNHTRSEAMLSARGTVLEVCHRQRRRVRVGGKRSGERSWASAVTGHRGTAGRRRSITTNTFARTSVRPPPHGRTRVHARTHTRARTHTPRTGGTALPPFSTGSERAAPATSQPLHSLHPGRGQAHHFAAPTARGISLGRYSSRRRCHHEAASLQRVAREVGPACQHLLLQLQHHGLRGEKPPPVIPARCHATVGAKCACQVSTPPKQLTAPPTLDRSQAGSLAHT